jgi:microcystin-dependent protein
MEGMIGEIRMFGGNFAPRAWALCDGQLLPINQNTALFSIIGTIYGGDGRTTFALPDIRGRCVIGPGNGPGLSSRREGQKGGTETNTLNVTQIPSHGHNHAIKCNSTAATTNDPTNAFFAAASGRTMSTPPAIVQIGMYNNSSNTNAASDAVTLNNSGGGQSFNDMMPYQTVNYVICLQGVFPSRS